MKNASAYTLIEIIVVMAVTSILAGIGLTSLNTINRRQSLVQNVKTIVSDLRLAKSLADSQQKFGSCGAMDDKLNGYRIIFSGDTLTIKVECNDISSDIYKSKVYPVAFAGISQIFFPVLHQSVTFNPTPESQQLQVTQNGQSITIKIESTGVINYE